jgi:hypothetical protein
MRLALTILGLTVAGTLNAAALDARSASEAEIEHALVGCWEREPTRELLELAAAGITNDYSVCFHAGNVVETTIFMGSYINGVPDFEGIGDSGRFEVSNGRLNLIGIQESGWTPARALVSCDVLMTADYAEMRLENCVGAGADPNGDNQYPEMIPSISFSKVAE